MTLQDVSTTQLVDELRNRGIAVALFEPEEFRDQTQRKYLENHMVEAGIEYIENECPPPPSLVL